MKKYFAILSALVLFAFCSCQKMDGELISQTFDIQGNYTALEVSHAFNVYVDEEATQVTVTAGENVMPKVVVKEEGNTLKIYLKPFMITTKEMNVVLPYNAALKKVNLSGASEFHTGNALVANEVEVTLSGASEFYGDIQAGEADMELSGASELEGSITASKLELELTGASNVTLTGNVTTLEIELSGASDIKEKIVGDQYALSCENCTGSISGSSNAYIHCNNSINVSVSGASDLHYTGDATTSGSTTSGASNIIHDKL